MYGSSRYRTVIIENIYIQKAKESEFECNCCGDSIMGNPEIGGEDIAPSWSVWSGGDTGGFNEDGNLFCSVVCSNNYYSSKYDS